MYIRSIYRQILTDLLDTGRGYPGAPDPRRGSPYEKPDFSYAIFHGKKEGSPLALAVVIDSKLHMFAAPVHFMQNDIESLKIEELEKENYRLLTECYKLQTEYYKLQLETISLLKELLKTEFKLTQSRGRNGAYKRIINSLKKQIEETKQGDLNLD